MADGISTRGGHGSVSSGGSNHGNMRQTVVPPGPSLRSARASSAAQYSAANKSNMEGKLPLPDDFFRAPQLNAKETKYLVNLAKRACKEVVYYSRKTGGPMNWVHLSSEDGVEVFQGMDASAGDDAKSITYLRGSTRIYASIDDIADFFKLDTPMKLSGFTQTVGKDLLDQKTLYNLAMPTEDNPKHYVGVKWTAVESPSKLARNRDFCYLECHDEFIDTNSSKRGWVRSVHSIRLPFCPPLDKSHGLVRASLYRSGFVFIESDDKSYVDAVHTLHMDVKGNAPNWVKILAMKRRIKNISEVNRYFQMRRLCEGRLLGDLELPSKSNVSKCQICMHKFGLFSRKSTCRKCGKVVCSNCGHHFILDYAGVGAKKVKICTHCSDRVVHGGGEGMGERPVSHLHAHRVDSTAERPIYDQSPSSRDTRVLKNRHMSIEEQEYLKRNEDASGMADINEAKRMHREFEEHFARSGLSLPDHAPPPPPPPPSSSNGSNSHQRHVVSDGYDPHRYEEDRRPLPNSAPLPRKSSKQRMSAYQEFMIQERERQISVGAAPPGLATHGAKNRNAATNRKPIVPSAAPPMPGDLLSRARQNQSFNAVPPPPPLVEEDLSFPPPLLDSIRISSDWQNDYVPPLSRLHRLRDNSSILSDDTVGAPIRRSDLSIGRSSRLSTSDMFRPSSVGRDTISDELPQRHPPVHPSYPSPSSTDSFSHDRRSANGSRLSHSTGPASLHSASTDYEYKELRQNYFKARNSGVKELENRLQVQATSTDDEGDFRYGYDESSAASDVAESLEEYEIPASADAASRMSRRKTVTERSNQRDPAEDLATEMALSAMRLYEKENGTDLHVSEETRQAALKKMVEIYSKEIERNSSEERKRAPRRAGRSASVTSNPGFGGSRGVRPNREHAQTMVAQRPQFVENTMEYRDLSDLSASAFKAFQKGTLHDDSSSVPRSDAEPSLPSTAAGTSRRRTSPGSKTSSRRNASLGQADSFGGDYAGTTNGSLPGSDNHAKPPSRPPSVRDDVSDTFSELDLIDLPHLMRADEAATNVERSNDDRLSQESQQTTFSEISSGRLSSNPIVAALDEVDLTRDSMYASLHAHPGIHSPSSGALPESADYVSGDDDVLSDDDEDFDEDEATSRTMMTRSELERYRASLAELMAEYNSEHNNGVAATTNGLQPEGEREPEKNPQGGGRGPKSPLGHVLQELYL